MKIKAIAKTCKAQKTVVTAVDEFKRKWVGTRRGLYAVKGIERFGHEELMMLFDVKESDRDDYILSGDEVAPEYSVYIDECDVCGGFSIGFAGSEYVMMVSKGTAYFVDADLLAPLADEENVTFGVEGGVIVAHAGLTMLAKIMPVRFTQEAGICKYVETAWKTLRYAPSTVEDKEEEDKEE